MLRFYLASLHEISMRDCCLVFCLNKIGIILHIVVVSCIGANLKLQQYIHIVEHVNKEFSN